MLCTAFEFDIVLLGLPQWLSGKEIVCNAGDAEDVDLVPGLGRSPEKKMAIHSSILAWEIPWIEKPGGLQSVGWQKMPHD